MNWKERSGLPTSPGTQPIPPVLQPLLSIFTNVPSFIAVANGTRVLLTYDLLSYSKSRIKYASKGISHVCGRQGKIHHYSSYASVHLCTNLS